ncbi:MAG: DUF2608 domain-containing protein [Parachlamydiaceae bacterium]|nr:DUF2608 domain-containing protein [Parachlamydiaceae bacterium]
MGIKFLRILFCVATFLITFMTEAKIIETVTIENIIPLIDDDTWLLVDLDNTTFEGKQALGHTEWFYDKAHAKMRNGMTLEEATRECYPEWIEVQKICPVKPVEEAFIPALVLMKQRGIVIMGLTHRQPSLVDSTLRQVASLGLNFLDSAPVKTTFAVPSETPTMYIQGILFTGEFNKKGEIFVRFLSIINQQPKKIVFIDDKRSHVEEVEMALMGLGIEYIGVHYTAIEHVEKVYSPEIAEFQHKFLNKILSNDGALLLMQHGLE